MKTLKDFWGDLGLKILIEPYLPTGQMIFLTDFNQVAANEETLKTKMAMIKNIDVLPPIGYEWGKDWELKRHGELS